MAKPIAFDEQNSHTPGGIPIYRDGARNVTCHALTPEELIEIINTGKIWVVSPGMNFPEISVLGTYPFDKVQN